MDAVEEVKSRLNIEDVIGEYVVLKRAGRNFRGLSPFSNEKTPSFMVSPEKQIWHDFSSGRGGTVFNFIMEMEGLDFKGSLELLARKAGVDLDQFKTTTHGSNSNDQKNRIYQVLEAATTFFQIHLTKNDLALRYVREKRAFSKETILQWRLGYAPNTNNSLITYLTKKGFTLDEQKRAGLTAMRRGQASDMFRERLVIPLTDSQGRVIGFTARLLRDESTQTSDAPKYINTPATILYDKSRHIFGLHLAKVDIRKSGFVVVAEGNLDVISSHQAGVRQVVASAGTAMTERHMRELKRFTGDIRLCFDTDDAGLSATERVIPMAASLGLNLGIIQLVGAKDPDELIRRKPTDWVKAIDHPVYALDWLIERYLGLLDVTTGQGKRKFTDIIMKHIQHLPDPVEKDHYIHVIAEKISVHPTALQEKMQSHNNSIPKKVLKRQNQQITKDITTYPEYHRAVDHLLALSLMQPRIRELLLELKPEMIPTSQALQVYSFLCSNSDFNGDPKEAKGLHSSIDYVRILALVYEELYAGLEFNELRNEATRCKSRVIEAYVKREKELLAAAFSEAGDIEARKLIARDKKLNNLLKKSLRR